MTKQLHVFFSIIIAMLCTGIAIPVQAQAPTWDGEGTADSPYLISSPEHLAAIPTQGLDKCYKLTAAITVDNWSVGIDNFAGTFDGDGYVITMTKATASLFKTINEGGTVKNLGVNAQIDAAAKVGGIAATNKGTIQYCYVEGSIKSTGFSYISGIADNRGTIEDCYTTVSVTITNTNIYSGGIAGGNHNGTIQRCYATGAISSLGSAGIAGIGIPTNSIQDCIALNKSITGTGPNHARVANGSGTFTGNYASPAIAGTWEKIGADKNDGADLIAANFIGKGAGEGAFTAWSGDIWDFGDNTNLPTLKGFKADQSVKDITRKSMLPELITSAADLATFRDAVNNGADYAGKTVTLTQDITVSDWATGINSFNGTFNGNGNTITLENATASLFSNISSEGIVQNLGVIATINGTKSVAGIAANNRGTIQYCYTAGTIKTTATGSGNVFSGGIVGYNYGNIYNCYSTADVGGASDGTGTSYVGGIAGYNNKNISTCYATGTITATEQKSRTSGIAFNSGTISKCIALNTGGITGTSTFIFRIANSGTLTGNYASPLIPGTWNNKEADKKDGADLTADNFINATGAAGAFVGWPTNASSGWDFTDNTKLPTLKGFKADQPVKDITRKSMMPELITSAADLATFRDAVNGGNSYADKTVTLTQDITVSDWTAGIHNFWGTFNGDGHVITLTGSASLFSSIGANGTVKNLGVNATISGTATVGGIAKDNYGTITNCYTKGTVATDGKAEAVGNIFAGGIVGSNYGTITNCYSAAAVTGSYYAGGIAGYNSIIQSNGSFSNCYSTGTITATGQNADVGGIVGEHSGGTISSCIALNNGGITNRNKSGRITSDTNKALSGNYASPLIPGTWENKGADKTDGEDLTEDNFITNATADNNAFKGWDSNNWDFGDNTGLPKLKTTGLTSDIVIAGQGDDNGNMPARADFLEKTKFEISTAVTYDEATHKDKDILVKNGGTFTIAADNASLKKLTLEDGGQVVAEKAFTCTTLLAPRTLSNKWMAYGSPVNMNAVAETQQQFHRLRGYINNGNQSWSSSGKGSGTSYLIATLYLIATDANDVAVTLTALAEGNDPVAIPADTEATTGEALNTGLFLFCANPTLKNVTIPVAYILSDDGTRFERKEKAVVKPFQSYLVANAATTQSVMSLRAGGLPTANEQPVLPDTSFRVWGSNGQLHLAADMPTKVVIYSLSGKPIRNLTLTGGQTLSLPHGIYLVNSNNITYKVSL